MRWTVLLVVPLLSAALVAACGDDDESPEALNQQFCDDLDAFGESLGDWTDLSVTSSVDDLEEQRDATRDAFDQLRESAAAAREPEIDSLEQSWNDLESVVNNFGDDAPFRESLDNLLTAASAVGDDLGAVVSANQCSDGDDGEDEGEGTPE
jgi:Lon protease-like protein